ncbi:GNAT family N-acetyltransferase [Microbacterium awajiense]|uniref:GNAT family N-acetyltransferase n=1 Tax=Microbacterium awajiense TaxID=415214 RepID=UPI0031D628D6
MLRPAVDSDIGALRAIDSACFPAGRADVEPAHEGELEGALAAGQITVAVRDGSVVGFMQTELLNPDHIYLAALAVRPEHQGSGIGGALVRRFRDEVADTTPRPSATTVTSPQNVAMIDLLTRNGFVGTRGIRDYFGPDKHRVYFQLKSRQRVADPDDRSLVPAVAVDHLLDLLADAETQLTSVVRSFQGTFVEVSRIEAEDRAGLRADEVSVSTGEAGAVLAALTFLLGFSFAVDAFSDALRILTLVATILTLGAAQVYANASGSLSRLQDDQFAGYMKWGNLLLEFGGVYPLVLVLPAVFANVSESLWLSLITSLAVTVLIILYEVSPFSISGRYSRDLAFWVLVSASALLPLAAMPLQQWTGSDTVWVAAVAVVLLVRLLWLVPGSRQELGVRMRPMRRR